MSRTAGAIDFRGLVPVRKLPVLLEAFDGLPEGGELLLESPVSLRPLYEDFVAVRGAGAGWHPLEARVAPHRARVRRLRSKEAVQGVEEFFSRDHDEIDAILSYLRLELQEAAGRGGPPGEAAARLREQVLLRLDRHIRWEEAILFPAVEERQPQVRLGLGAKLRADHVTIRDLAADLARGDGGATEILGRADLLWAALAPHNRAETALFYPMSDYLFTQEEDARVMAAVHAEP